MLGQHCGALRFVLPKPCLEGVGCVERVERVHRRIGDDPDAGGTGSESDEPDPVAVAHQVVGGHRTFALDEALLPCGVITPTTDVDLRGDT